MKEKIQHNHPFLLLKILRIQGDSGEGDAIVFLICVHKGRWSQRSFADLDLTYYTTELIRLNTTEIGLKMMFLLFFKDRAKGLCHLLAAR